MCVVCVCMCMCVCVSSVSSITSGEASAPGEWFAGNAGPWAAMAVVSAKI